MCSIVSRVCWQRQHNGELTRPILCKLLFVGKILCNSLNLNQFRFFVHLKVVKKIFDQSQRVTYVYITVESATVPIKQYILYHGCVFFLLLTVVQYFPITGKVVELSRAVMSSFGKLVDSYRLLQCTYWNNSFHRYLFLKHPAERERERERERLRYPLYALIPSNMRYMLFVIYTGTGTDQRPRCW